jgi:hypothetical protein
MQGCGFAWLSVNNAATTFCLNPRPDFLLTPTLSTVASKASKTCHHTVGLAASVSAEKAGKRDRWIMRTGVPRGIVGVMGVIRTVECAAV